ncbi:MAG: transposase zinc-binding domain-containing protein [Saprospiraceae bacterium]|nr:transposase zinc-binding domain-containing protein [Saprospiraceae bacterium]
MIYLHIAQCDLVKAHSPWTDFTRSGAMRTKYELADVVKHFGSKLRGNITPLQIKVLDKISQCRTATLGGHEEVCDRCGTCTLQL